MAETSDVRKCDAASLRESIYHRHRKQAVVIVDELRVSCGQDAQRVIDCFVISPDTRGACATQAYEIKVSRSDFLRDMKQPLKQRGAQLISDQFWFVAPAGIIKPDEVPLWAGLLEAKFGYADYGLYGGRYCSPQMWLLTEAVPAPLRSKAPPSWPLVVSLLRKEPVVLEPWGEDTLGGQGE